MIKSLIVLVVIILLTACSADEITSKSNVEEIMDSIIEDVTEPITIIEEFLSTEVKIINHFEERGFTCGDDYVCFKSINEDGIRTRIIIEEFDLNSMTYTYNNLSYNSDNMIVIDVIISLSRGLGGYENRSVSFVSPNSMQHLIIQDLLTGENTFTIEANGLNPVFDEEFLQMAFDSFKQQIESMLIETSGFSIEEYIHKNYQLNS